MRYLKDLNFNSFMLFYEWTSKSKIVKRPPHNHLNDCDNWNMESSYANCVRVWSAISFKQLTILLKNVLYCIIFKTWYLNELELPTLL